MTWSFFTREVGFLGRCGADISQLRLITIARERSLDGVIGQMVGSLAG